MHLPTIIALLIGAILGWLACHYQHLRTEHHLRAEIQRGLQFQTSLVQQLQERSAGEARDRRTALQSLEQGRHDHVMRLLAGSVAAYYHSWKAAPESNRMSQRVGQELKEIEKAAELSNTLRLAIQNTSGNEGKRD